MIKVAIVDDQPLMREGLKTILNSYDTIEVVVTGQDGHEAIDLCLHYQFDVLLLDIRMPNLDGVQAVKEIKKVKKDMKILILTTFDDEDYIIEAISFGANGYVFKDVEYDQLVKNIEDVYNERYVMPAKVAQVLANRLIHDERKKSKLDAFQFTGRERDIIEMVNKSLTNKQIASKLFISEGTVKNYLSGIYTKTGCSNRKELLNMMTKL